MGLGDFEVLTKLGEGTYSSVWRVKRISDGQEYALKKVKLTSLTEKEKQNSVNEVRILASIQDSTIVGYKEAFLEDNSKTLCIVMEYAAGGDLYNKINEHIKAKTCFKEEEIWTYAVQMIHGLKILHDMKILHRDLKCANIFLDADGKGAKLGDLNVSKVLKTNLVYTQTGTPYYASPEIWRDQPYDMKSDIWSLGCVIYEMAALKPPFRAKDMEGLYRKVQKGAFDKIPSQYSNDLTVLISQCLKVSSVMRPTCQQLLKHPIILRNGKENLRNPSDAMQNVLLSTMRFPKNVKMLTGILPKPNYFGVRDTEVKKLPKISNANPNPNGNVYIQRGYGPVSRTTETNEDERTSIRHDFSSETRAGIPARLDTKVLKGMERESPFRQNSDSQSHIRVNKIAESNVSRELAVLHENTNHSKLAYSRPPYGKKMSRETHNPDLKKMDTLDEYENQLRRYSNNVPPEFRSKSTVPMHGDKIYENLLTSDICNTSVLDTAKTAASRDKTPSKIIVKQTEPLANYKIRADILANRQENRRVVRRGHDENAVGSETRSIAGRHIVAGNTHASKSAMEGAHRSNDVQYNDFLTEASDGASHYSYIAEMRNGYGQSILDEVDRHLLKKTDQSSSNKYMANKMLYKDNNESLLKRKRQPTREEL